MTLFTILICCSSKKGSRHLFKFDLKHWHIHMFQPYWLILRILHQSFEIERHKGHLSEIVVYLSIYLSIYLDFHVRIIYIFFTLKNPNPIYGELPKYILQYLVTAWHNEFIFTFSKTFEVMSNI